MRNGRRISFFISQEDVKSILNELRSALVCTGVIRMWKLNPWGVLKSNKIKELWRARSLLYRRRFLRPNTHFSAFFEIYKIQNPLHLSKPKNSQNFTETFSIFCVKIWDFFVERMFDFSWEFPSWTFTKAKIEYLPGKYSVLAFVNV